MRAVIGRRPGGDDRRPKLTQPFDPEHHLVAGLEVAAEGLLADLEQAAAADRPAAQQVAGAELDVGRGPFQHLPEREMDAGPGAAARFDAVDGRGHLEIEASRGSPVRELIGRHQPRPDRRREVLALGRPQSNGRLLALEVACGPVVEDHVAADHRFGAVGRQIAGRGVHERRDLQLVVELRRASRRPNGFAGSANFRHVAEVEDRQSEPRLRDLAAPPRPHRPDVPLERVEVPQRRGTKDRRTERQIVDGEDGLVLVRFASRFEALQHRPQGLDTEARGQVVVERRDRPPEHRLVVGELGLRRNGAPPGNLEVEPALRGLAGVKCGRQPPRNAGWGMALSDVGEPHVSDG